MARSPGDDAPPEGSGLADVKTVAIPLRKVGTRRDNVYTVGPGTILAGKYRVERTIGRGGMGIVVEAWHRDLDARVAIKLLLPEFMSFAEAAERFMREARAVAKLQSQHVARVLDVGTLDSGEPYMVMEYLAGEDLAFRARAAGPFAIGDAVDYVVQACDALAEAHARGIIHRDLKPANLFLTARPDGAPLVKLLDFGVSKILGEGSGDVALTQTTMILGSALYMSPEQMRSAKSVDHRTDIYALGACLFEMIGGRTPYSAGSFPELCAKIYTSAPEPLSELRPEVPEGLAQVIERCIAREPEGRYATVAELVQALAPYARDDTRTAVATILRQHAPDLALPPPASGQRVRPGLARGAGGGARVRGSATPEEVERRRRSRAPWILAGAAVVATIAWGALRAGAFGPKRAGGEDVAAGPVAGAVATAPLPEVAATDPSATGSAGATRGAPAGARGAATAAAEGPRSGEPGWGTPGSEAPPSATARTSPPPVSTDLVQETCTAVMPDGTRKSVPCN
jgi:serine/threonine-protein kinase